MNRMDLSKKEKALLKTMHVSARAEEEITKVWQTGEYKYQREYTNVLLLLMPMFIIVFLASTGFPELAAMKNIFGWAAWVLYFAIPTFIILRICFRTLASHDRTVLLGHSALYLWRRPKLLKTNLQYGCFIAAHTDSCKIRPDNYQPLPGSNIYHNRDLYNYDTQESAKRA